MKNKKQSSKRILNVKIIRQVDTDPDTSNLRQIEDVLTEANAKHLADVAGPGSGVLGFYSIGGKVLIVQEYGEQNGFEVFTPLSGSMKVAEMVAAIRRYAGVLLPCPNCMDRPGKDGLGRVCGRCGGSGEVKASQVLCPGL